jgi:hypothetical protein
MTVRWTAPFVQLLDVMHHDPEQQELPAPTQLNYDPPPRRIVRQFRPGLSHMAGFSQQGMPQTWGGFGAAYLPPPVRVGPIQRIRNVGGAYGLGKPGSSTVHVPSVLVPKTVG